MQTGKSLPTYIMSVATMYFKRTILKEYKVAVETKWCRVPLYDTPEWMVCRERVLELVKYDPLDMKSTALYRVKGNSIEKDKNNNPRSIAIVGYVYTTTKANLKLAHELVSSAIVAGLLPTGEGGNLDKWLQEQHVGQLESLLINYRPNTKFSSKVGF